MSQAQFSFAGLAALFTVAGSMLIDAGHPDIGTTMIIFALIGFTMLGAMIVYTAFKPRP